MAYSRCRLISTSRYGRSPGRNSSPVYADVVRLLTEPGQPGELGANDSRCNVSCWRIRMLRMKDAVVAPGAHLGGRRLGGTPRHQSCLFLTPGGVYFSQVLNQSRGWRFSKRSDW